MTADEVRAARDAGHAAGRTLAPPSSNPYTAAFVPVWAGPRATDQKLAAARRSAVSRVLAAVWLSAYRAGQADYATGRGVALPTEL